MAQEFIGSNNIALLEPRGQFGSRLQGGNDAASDRYIFTQLNTLTGIIYSNDDSSILNYLDDDGTSVEPEYYLPIIPMVLVNGGKGIGTGFSYEGLPYHPMNVIKALKSKIEQPELAAPDAGLPYYEGFKGTIQDINHSKFLIKGTYEVISDDTVRITELPVGSWTDTYKVFLETLMSDKNKKGKKIKPIIKKINDMSTDALVDITVKFAKPYVHKYIKSQQEFNVNKLEKILKLTTTKSATNMHLFDPDQKIKKYTSTGEIIDDYYPVRFKGYQLRKKYMTDKLKREVMLLSNKARFIEEQCQDIIDLRKKKKQVVIELLKTRGYDVIDDDEEYKYLRNMPIDSVIEENIIELRNKRDEKKKELDILVNTTIKQMWMRDLKQLEDKFDGYVKQRENRLYGIIKTKKSSKKSK
jgi:DNA topoisomerase-2